MNISTPRAKVRKRSRGSSYIGVLQRTLRDLTGYSVLAYELIQNADDAAGATAMSFNVCDDALIVWNDGHFEDCGYQDARPDACPWRQQRGQRCDFHSFRNVSGGDKAARADTTGSFGIGFTAVYQITDRPELISSGLHWFLDEMADEDDRITEHDDCPTCHGERGTRFILPWARDPDSPFRVATEARIVGPNGPAELLTTVVSVVPTAMLFLKTIRTITVMENGAILQVFKREEVAGDVLIGNSSSDQLWRVYRGDFQEEATALREASPRDTEKRQTTVRVAVPTSGAADGLLFADLPTEETIPLPLYINADFFPMSDRKRLLTDGLGGEWNRLAIQTAAEVVADHVEDLAAVLGPVGLWRLLRSAYEISSATVTASRKLALGSFWDGLLERLPTARIAFTSRQEWEAPAAVYLAVDASEQDSFDVLESVGLKMLHADLRSSAFQLPRGKIGLANLTLDAVVTVLQDMGLFGRRSGPDVPAWFADPASRAVLYREIELLLSREGKSGVGTMADLAQLTLAPGRDGALWPLADLYRGDNEAWAVFGSLATNHGFLDAGQMPQEVPHLTALTQSFDVAEAIAILSGVGNDRLIELQTTGVWSGREAIAWLARNEQAVLEDKALVGALTRLPLFPSHGGPRPLTELALPGDFRDPLGLAGLVDDQEADEHVTFFRRLGARELTFLSYVTDSLPYVADTATEEEWSEVIDLLVTRLGEIADDLKAQRVLRGLPLVQCLNGDSTFVTPSQAYFPDDQVAAVLGPSYIQAIVPSERNEAFVAFYEWLGVARHPRAADITRRISTLIAVPPTPAAKEQIAAILEYLGAHWTVDPTYETILTFLGGQLWLPARGDSTGWHTPAELCMVFQEYLFASQARFIDLPYAAQTGARDLLMRLGSRDVPETLEVVRHLLYCSEHNTPVNVAVYTTLNQHANDDALDELLGRNCLRMPDGRWVAPDWVFWGEQPFGRFRGSLGPSFRSYADLLDRLQVRESPDYTDAIAVLDDLSKEFGPGNTPLKRIDDLFVYDSCWRLLDTALADETADEDRIRALSSHKVVLDGNSVLTRPPLVLFDDMPGLADRFDRLLRVSLIRRPASGWRAMMAAGVRSLSEAVTTSVVEIGDRLPNETLRGILAERLMSLLRVVSPFVSIGRGAFHDRVQSVQLLATDKLVIQGTLHGALGRTEFHTAPYSEDALYVDGDQKLYVVPSDVGKTPLVTARELLRKIAPEVPLGSIAASAALVLTASSAGAAEKVLDEAGVPRLALDVDSPDRTPVIEAFGGTDQPEDFDPTLAPTPGVEPPLVGAVDLPVTGAPTGSPRTNGSPPRQAGDEPGGTGVDGGDETTRDGKPPRPDSQFPTVQRSRLRSYVVSESASDDDEGTEERARVDAGGIDAVLAHERNCGRDPRAMPPGHPGYDIESLVHGDVERYIEVKAASGAWDSLGVALSSTQFTKGQVVATKFWLYVVEYALSADPRIYRIQDPSNRVDQFFYDDGWAGAAESDDDGD